MTMLRNYLKIALRSLRSRALPAIINICGLVTGMCGAMLIAMFVLDELKYDQHFSNKDRIYRLTSSFEQNGVAHNSAQTTADVSAIFQGQFPEIQNITRLMSPDEAFLFAGETVFKQEIIYTDADFLKVFKLDMLLGTADECLKNPSSTIISETMAVKLFGPDWRLREVLGKTLSVDNWIPLGITGVFKDLPGHTHFNAHLFASVPSGFESWMSDDSGIYTYVLLHRYADADQFEDKLKTESYNLPEHRARGKQRINAQALTDIYFSSGLEEENAVRGNKKNLYALILSALALILITVTNFANLYTASALNRLKEVGIRKAIGAVSRQIRYQFLSEALLMTVLSTALALLIVVAFLPVFNELGNKSFSFGNFLEPKFLMLISGLMICVAFAAGVYPSVILSRTSAMHSFKRTGQFISFAAWRKGLIMLQFWMSAITITLSLVASSQVGLINTRSLGFNKEHTVAVANPYMMGSTDGIIELKEQLRMVPGIEYVSLTGYTPSQNRWENHEMTFPDRNPQSGYGQVANWIVVDEAFIKTLGLTLIAGRNFHNDVQQDMEAIIINEEAAKRFGLNQNGKNVLGTQLSINGQEGKGLKNYTVVGVVKDFNFGSLHEAVKPLIMRAGLHRFEMVLRLSPLHAAQEVLARAESVWKRNLPMIPFEYSFIKDRFDRLHEADKDAGSMFLVLCVLTIVVSAMGLFSIVAYSINRRTKEIGIRKVLGASEKSITFLIANDFLMLILAAYVLSLPFSGFLVSHWLADFAYKIEVSWTSYGISALVLALVTVVTLGFQTGKLASLNPVESLRTD